MTRLVPAVWYCTALSRRRFLFDALFSYNFLDMLREVSSVKSKKYFKLQFENVYGGQGSFAGISFDRYLPTAIVVVSVLVAFNFFRSECLHLPHSSSFYFPYSLSFVSQLLQQNERVF